MRKGFTVGAMLAAIGAMFQTRELQQRALPQVERTHDDFSHSRGKRQLHSAAFIRKRRRKRNIRNEIAFQSRKRNRA